jgi:Tol biopolymer transport system component
VYSGNFQWDVWIFDIATRTLTRLTRDFTGVRPFGWADSRHLVYLGLDSADIDGPRRVVMQPWDGSAPPQDLMRLPISVHDVTFSTLRENAVIGEYGVPDIWIAPWRRPAEARRLIATNAWEGESRLSRDGRLLAFTSHESGRPEVYVRSMVGPPARIQVSDAGGRQPVWSPDGLHLYFREPLIDDSPGGTMLRMTYVMRATIARTPTMAVIARDTLFRDVYAPHNFTNYDVFPDGKKLLMIRTHAGRTRIGMVHNWGELLRNDAERQ